MKNADFQGLIAGLESQGLSRTEIARAAGISRQTVWRIASGQAREPGFNTIRRLEHVERIIPTPVTPMRQKIG